MIGSYATINAGARLPEELLLALQAAGITLSGSAQSVAGGCIALCYQALSNRGPLFIKVLGNAPDSFFAAEAAGLQALRDSNTVTTPAVIAVAKDFICLEQLERTPCSAASWGQLGMELAALHNMPQPDFGFEGDNFCGRTPQPNTPSGDGHGFFAEQRLWYQGTLASQRGLLQKDDMTRLQRLCTRLKEHLPTQPPALIHGDLWSGNVICHGDQPVLIDPACYRGWAEAELAMTTLFGSFPVQFYDAYERHGRAASDWRQRTDLYNLYHLLNHLNLFGHAYYAEVRRILLFYGR